MLKTLYTYLYIVQCTGLYGFEKFLVFVKTCQSSKFTDIRILALGNDIFSNININAFGYIHFVQYFLLSACSFGVSERPSKCTVGVRVVIVMAAYSA